ncbi:DUF885 domain-containing protein [Luteimonas sp. SJ-92]|uniref:DUF885 domain-containing protein n=1 Tax=Luteimonas salinisoli TaxID=2752307 RepID=A0A853J9N1_9GAMM|nr:DUF885 domain-containing protein [Luteimonas salinisoli]NZA25565.1 DUF885 domain-containing protein [Luteimonas salinisoli]
MLTMAMLLLSVSSPAEPPPHPRSVDAIATQVVEVQLSLEPVAAYLHGLPLPRHDSFGARTPDELAGARDRYDELRTELAAIDPSSLPERDAVTFAVTEEYLQAEHGLRVCRRELWAVDHMFGWHRILPIIAARQPVDTPEQRSQALQRWGSLGAWVDAEIENLRTGLSAGYSAPRPVVVRVLAQLESMTGEGATSPVDSPAARATDPAFASAFQEIIGEVVDPALRRYSRFLKDEYLSGARAGLGISEHPSGEACYAASLRYYTTLQDSPEAIMRLGASTVARNLAEIAAMTGKPRRDLDLPELMRSIREHPANGFASEEEIFGLTKELVEKGRQASKEIFVALPRQRLEVTLYPPHLRGSGVSSHYEPGGDAGRPARFMLQTDDWEQQRRSDIEILAFHEAFPGHHLQQGLVADAQSHPISRLAGNSAYTEGWGRYAEALAEELGLYSSELSRIQRRLWPARGMVADPGLHTKGWTRDQTYHYLLETGRFTPAQTDDLIDRMAILPGQLTAYDAGGLQFRALREKAEAALGSRFSLVQFHSLLLDKGPVPLSALQRMVDGWIAAKTRERAGVEDAGRGTSR